MKYFNTPNGVHAIEADGSQDFLIKEDWVEMTAEEIYAHEHPTPTPEQLAAIERAWRDGELDRADIELNKVQDGMGTGTVSAWREYRCALRNWPEHESFPDSSFRPNAPDAPKEPAASEPTTVEPTTGE